MCGKELNKVMNRNQRKLRLNRSLTVALSLLVAVTLCVTIIAFTAAKRAKPAEQQTSSSQSTSQTTSKPKSTSSSKPISTSPDDNPTSVNPTKLICPVAEGYLSKEFSSDVPVWSLTMEDYRIHSGIDIEADAGTAVLACADGVISAIYADPMMGQTIVIDHSGECKSVYKNLQTKLPEGIGVGSKVSVGEAIGYVGDTALIEISDSPHLHFEFQKSLESVNPLTFFSVPQKSAESDYED